MNGFLGSRMRLLQRRSLKCVPVLTCHGKNRLSEADWFNFFQTILRLSRSGISNISCR